MIEGKRVEVWVTFRGIARRDRLGRYKVAFILLRRATEKLYPRLPVLHSL